MNIYKKIKEDLVSAMKSKNESEKNVLKSVLSGFTNELVASGKTPQEKVEDDLAKKVLKREAKKRKDAFDQFEKGGRADLAEIEKIELAIIEKYLPEPMSEDQIKKIAQELQQEMEIFDSSKSGILTGAVMKKTAGEASGEIVKKIVEELF